MLDPEGTAQVPGSFPGSGDTVGTGHPGSASWLWQHTCKALENGCCPGTPRSYTPLARAPKTQDTAGASWRMCACWAEGSSGSTQN